jgi:hypothetical protein
MHCLILYAIYYIAVETLPKEFRLSHGPVMYGTFGVKGEGIAISEDDMTWGSNV